MEIATVGQGRDDGRDARIRVCRARQAHLHALTRVEQAVGAVLDDLKHSQLTHPRGEARHSLVADASVGGALDHGNGGVRGEQANVVAINVVARRKQCRRVIIGSGDA